MAESLRGGLSLTSSGFGFWSHDIGGFEHTSTPDVYKRWAAFGLLSTHSRLHGSTSYRVPWVYDEEAVDVLRFFTRLKLELMPYLYSAAAVTSRTGIPMMRSMALEFEEDCNCRYLDKQYMQGNSLLVAPIFREDGTARYYLPNGTWVNYLTGETASGGVWRQEHHDYLSIPLWVRADSVIATGIAYDNADYLFKDNLELKVFALENRAETTVYQAGKELVQAVFEKEGSAVKGHVTGGAGCRIRFVNCILTNIEGADWEICGKDTLLHIKEEDFHFYGLAI